MRLLIRLIIIGILFSSCYEGKRTSRRYKYYRADVILNSRISLTLKDAWLSSYYEYDILKDSSKTIFELSYAEGDSSYTDGGIAETLLFEISSRNNEFNITDSEFDNYAGIYTKSCFCFSEEFLPKRVISGTVSGKKIQSNSWIIEVNTGMLLFKDTIYTNINNKIDLM